MFHRATVQYSPVLHVVVRMRSSDQAHGNHEQQLAKIMAEVGIFTRPLDSWKYIPALVQYSPVLHGN